MLLDIGIGPAPEHDHLAVELLVDGADVLPDHLRGADPDALLPPLSAALLPSSLGRSAMIGICLCGEAGCASFSVQVRRTGERVLWEPDPQPIGETLTGALDFPLLAYLDAVDAAAADPQLHGRGRRLVRAAEQWLERHFDKYDGGGREVTLPVAWQNGDGNVNLRYRGQLHAVPMADLPEDDAAAVAALTCFALDPQRLPPAAG